MKKSAVAAFLLSFLLGAAVWGQGSTPVGGEFEVNSYTTGRQSHPTVTTVSEGNFLLPWRTSTALGAAWMSEYPYTVVEPVFPWGNRFHEPRGSRRAAPIHWINLQLSKAFHLGPTRLTLIGSVMNLLDDEQVTSVCEGYWGCTIDEEHYELDEPIFYMQPRHYELGVRVEF